VLPRCGRLGQYRLSPSALGPWSHQQRTLHAWGAQIDPRSSVSFYVKAALILAAMAALYYGTFFAFQGFAVRAGLLEPSGLCAMAPLRPYSLAVPILFPTAAVARNRDGVTYQFDTKTRSSCTEYASGWHPAVQRVPCTGSAQPIPRRRSPLARARAGGSGGECPLGRAAGCELPQAPAVSGVRPGGRRRWAARCCWAWQWRRWASASCTTPTTARAARARGARWRPP